MFVILLLVFSIIGMLLYTRSKKMSILSRNGIPGPKPNLIYGNFVEFRKKPSPLMHNQWIEKYGNIFGYYFGEKPNIVVTDPELIKNIQIKDFHIFTDRPHLQFKDGIIANPEMRPSIGRLHGNQWKTIRNVLTPTFSAAKLKTMVPIMDDSINTLIDIINEKAKCGDEFNIYEMFQGLTSDVIGRTAFGIQTDVQRDPNDKFLKASHAFFDRKTNPLIFVLIVCYQKVDFILYPYRRMQEIIKQYMGTSHMGYLLRMCSEIIHLRRNNPNFKRKDLLQLMMDAKIPNNSIINNNHLTVDVNEDIKSEHNDEINSVIKNYRSLSDEEIRANSVIFFEAGYETTSTALGFVIHIIINYPQIQEKMRDEVKELFANEGKFNYNTATKLQYMECVINETMRIYAPVTSFVTREVLKDYNYGDKILPKGSTVHIPVHYLHHDPNLWENPEKFDPNRFSPENKSRIHPSAFQAFGNGPRNCIGMRFALLEMKLTLSKLLLKFRFETGPKTQIKNISVDYKFITQSPKYGVFVKAIKL